MENILPIILAILYFGYKQYRKSIDANKDTKEHITTIETEEVKSANSLDGFISSFIGLDDEVLQKDIDKYQERQTPITNVEEVDMEEIIDETDETDETEYDKHRSISKERLKRKEVVEELDDTNIIDFDLRQAVIYDAIFNAPYINK